VPPYKKYLNTNHKVLSVSYYQDSRMLRQWWRYLAY